MGLIMSDVKANLDLSKQRVMSVAVSGSRESARADSDRRPTARVPAGPESPRRAANTGLMLSLL